MTDQFVHCDSSGSHSRDGSTGRREQTLHYRGVVLRQARYYGTAHAVRGRNAGHWMVCGKGPWYAAKVLRFFADGAAKKWPLRGSRSQKSRKSEANICLSPAVCV